MEETTPKKSRKKLIIAIVIAAAAAAAVIAGYFIYMSIGSKYTSILFPNTYVNGVDVSGLTPEEAEEKVLAQHKDYSIDILFRNGDEEKVDGAEFDYDYVLAEHFDKFVAGQDVGAWLSEEQKDWLLALLMEEKKKVDDELDAAGGGHI